MHEGAPVVWWIAAITVIAVCMVKVWSVGKPDQHKRGVLIVDARAARRRPGARGITLAGVRVPRHDETKHFKMLGTTGTGKSTAIREVLAGALGRGDRAVVADPDGGYVARFFNRYRGDVILNPFDPSSVRWDVFAEIHDSYDVDQLAAALIASSEDVAANEWRSYARTFLSAVLRCCRFEKPTARTDLWRLLAVASSEELRDVVAGSPAMPFLEPDNARMFGSIRAVALSALAAYEYVHAQRATPFSVREWVRDPESRGVLFIPYKAVQIASLRCLIAAWLRLAVFETMNGREDVDQSLWFIVDELDALGAIDGLKDALARLRKFGGRCVLGFQSIAQVSGTYGTSAAQTIVENCGNTLVLRCAGSEQGGTSQFASRLIGEREVIRRQRSRGHDREGGFAWRGGRRSTNVSEQHVTESAVLASQIERLADFHGYLKLASSPAWRYVRVGPTPRGGT